jgi:hypothetical protein
MLECAPMSKTEPGNAPFSLFEEELAEFFGETAAGVSLPPARDHVTFQAAERMAPPLEAAEDPVRHVRAQNKTRAHLSRDTRVNARTHTSYSGAVTVRVAFHGHRFKTIRFRATDSGELLASYNGAGRSALSLILQEWLVASDRFSRPCWRTADEWKRGEPGHSAPT